MCCPRFGACAIRVIVTRNELERPILDRKVCMGQAQALAHPHPRLVHERQEEAIPDMGTGVEQLLDLFAGQRLWLSLFSFDRDHTCCFRLGLSNAMQEWFVFPAMRKSELIQWKLRNGLEPHMVGVESVNRSQRQIDGRIRSLSNPWCN